MNPLTLTVGLTYIILATLSGGWPVAVVIGCVLIILQVVAAQARDREREQAEQMLHSTNRSLAIYRQRLATHAEENPDL